MSLTLATAESYRAAGVLLAMAAGDALGAGHELITPHVANPPDAALIDELQRMVEEEQYCIDILTQVSAMTKALQSVSLGLLDEHLSHCVVNAVAAGGPEADAKLKEAAAAPTPDQANKLYQEAEQYLVNDLPAFPEWYDSAVVGWSDKVTNVDTNAFGVADYANITPK